MLCHVDPINIGLHKATAENKKRQNQLRIPWDLIFKLEEVWFNPRFCNIAKLQFCSLSENEECETQFGEFLQIYARQNPYFSI